ncbi:hypothetical protein G4H71_08045 [Rhodococcus triatomae]|uniref:Uncharacterized protein n=1 Tax=Rhodococcus triatomae TaxID=300028 RepID=A0A1G8IMN9_9NOCA|nr:hypothetical protein [Rhodococcus triatomae]QNG21093.1 hypothetical protein G4H72_22340 [Rhodococcus triatomae]QNG22995.1 hypothetical protein G4H71_08045 [Rhodococcus triatomae]SDI20102.1 hypothetical protein SAMN05444695_105328 [Rhodococcus triatomae]
MSDSLKDRVREKLLRQRSEDGGRPVQEAEQGDQRLVAIDRDLAVLDQAAEGDKVIEELAAKYWVP